MRSIRSSVRVFTLVVLTAILLASAFRSVGTAQAQASSKSITISFTQEPDNLNPMYSTQDFSGLARSLILKSLWDYDDQLNLVPSIAKEIPTAANGGLSADGKTITVKLRDNLLWSDGEKITADDVVFTAQMYASDKNSPLGRDPYDKLKVSAPDATTVVFTFSEPYAPWASALKDAILPAHILRPVFEKDGTLDKADWNTNPTVGSGPFTLKEYQKGQFLLLVRNDKYALAPAKLDQILIKIVPDDATQVAALKSGDSDVGYFVPVPDAADLKASSPVNVFTVSSGYNEGWFFNLNPDKGHPALQDVRVRQALAMGVNRAELITGLLNDLVKPSAGFWDGTPYQDPSLTPFAYDPDGAKKLLDDAGWKAGADGIRVKDGQTLKLRYVTNTRGLRKDAQRLVEEQFKVIGVALDLINVANKDFLASYDQNGPVARGEFDIAEWSTSPKFPDPTSSRFLISEIGTAANNFVGANWAHISDKTLDDLFATERTTIDVSARTKVFYQISKIVHDQVYWMGLWQDPDIWVVNKRISGIKFSGARPFWNITDWDIVSK